MVTGAAGGIGSATAARFAAEGASVVLCDIDGPGCERVAAGIRTSGGTVCAHQADLTREAEIAGLFARAVDTYGRVDILANIAGADAENQVGVDEISPAALDRNLDINLKSCILCCREAVKLMMPRKYGRIVNMSSLAYRGNPLQYTYSAAKGGVFSFTRSLAMSMGFYNITVNALAPALIEVDLIKNALGPEMWQALREDCAARYPLGRVGQPGDVAACALFFASDDAAFVTGQVLEVSGGARL